MKIIRRIALIIVIMIIFLTTKTYASRIRYDELITGHNVGNVIILASWDDLGDTNKLNKIKALLGNKYKTNPVESNVVNMGYEYHHTYCVQHDAQNVLADMRVKHYIKLQGTQMVEHIWADKEDDTWKAKNGSKYDGSENAILAYILANNKDSTVKYNNANYTCRWSTWTKSFIQTDSNHENGVADGPRQIALKKYWNTWLSTVANAKVMSNDAWRLNNEVSTSVTYYTAGSAGLLDAQTNYSVGNKASISATETSVSGSNPALHVKYVGTISSVNGTATDKTQISSNNIKFYSDSAHKNEIKMANIPNDGKSFYIGNTSGKTIKNVKINVKKADTHQVELWMLESTGWLGNEKLTSNDTPSVCQKLMTVKESIVPTTANTTITYKDQGTITINKTDENNTNIKLNAGFKIHVGDFNFLGVDGNGNWVYNKKFSDAKIFYTTNGTVTINNLALRSYGIWEVVPPKDYDLTIQSEYTSSKDTKNDKGQTYYFAYHNNTTLSASNLSTVFDTTNRLGSIKVTKKDAVNKNTITEVTKFRVENKSKGWLKGTKGSYTFVSINDNPDLYETNDDVLYLNGLPAGEYIIQEVEAPTGYDLSVQTDTKVTLTINKANPNPSGEIKNLKYISVKGYVWKDVQAGKNSNSNSLYDTDETKIAGVTVRLRKKGDTSANVPSTTTNENGEYIFNNAIPENEIDSYYVEFDYSGLDNLKATYLDAEDNEHKYINYIPVELKPTEANGSKALMNTVAEKDIDLSGIALTYAGTDATTISKYGLSKVGTISNGVLTNVNLGLIMIPTPDYNISEDLETITINMKGYKYTYKYGDSGNSDFAGAPLVNYQKKNDIRTYSQNVYPSDIAYCVENSTEELKMEVKYKIDIKNTTNVSIDNLYKEETLHITSLTDTFDKERYTLKDDNWTAEEGGNIATIKEDYLTDIKETGLGIDKTGTKYINFSVKHNAILAILNNPNGIIEAFPTQATARGYHKYTRNDHSWSTNSNNHITADMKKSDNAPYVIFKLGPERIISGKVFKDGIVTNNGEVLGNGEYDDGEKGVADVNVELLDLNGTETDITKLSVSNVYGIKEEGVGDDLRKTISKTAQVKTNEDGSYSLNGVVPGQYYLRFVYGNGTYKITDLDGNLVDTNVESKIDNSKIEAKDYKSTIIPEENDIIRKALNGDDDVEWYKKLNKNKYFSVAIDNLEQRKAINEKTLNTMMAGTGKVSITVENTEEKEANVKQQAKFDAQGNEKVQEEEELEFPNKNKFKGLSFGIIEVPKQKLEIKKIITNVNLTNSQGNVLYNGNPETEQSFGVVALNDLDNETNGGSTYVRSEVQDTNTYGTNLELTYEVSITNKSDINYYNNEYYRYGEKVEKKEVTLEPNEVIDYLDKTLTYIEEKSDKDRIHLKEGTTNIQVDGESIKAQEMELKDWKKLYTNKNTSRNVEDTTDKVKIVAKRILSNNDDDMEIVSRAEIKTASRNPDPADPDLLTKEAEVMEQLKIAPTEVHSNGMVKATFTITPPTGENRGIITIYAIAGIIALILLSTGIVIIKKKII